MLIPAALIAALLLLAACSDGGSAATPSGETNPEPTVVSDPSTGDAQGEPSTSLPADTSTTEQTAAPEPEPLEVALSGGRYCYAGDDGITEMYVRMTVHDTGEVFGDTRIFISDEENGYFTSGFQRFDGEFNPDGSIVTRLTTWIEFDIQESVESWSVLPLSLQTGNDTLEATPCDVVREAYVDVTQAGTNIGITADELLDRTFAIDERVQFNPGSTSATVSNAVVRGDADRYVFGSTGGQRMTVSISSLEDNAVMDVVSDSGIVLALEIESAEIFLPHSGDYFIIVSGTRGNASYDLTVSIEFG